MSSICSRFSTTRCTPPSSFFTRAYSCGLLRCSPKDVPSHQRALSFLFFPFPTPLPPPARSDARLDHQRHSTAWGHVTADILLRTHPHVAGNKHLQLVCVARSSGVALPLFLTVPHQVHTHDWDSFTFDRTGTVLWRASFKAVYVTAPSLHQRGCRGHPASSWRSACTLRCMWAVPLSLSSAGM